MHYNFKNRGTCSQAVEFDYEDGRVYNVRFIGGCRGNTQGVARLAEGMEARDIVARCEGILCREGTSCPDQFARALKEVLKTENAAANSDDVTDADNKTVAVAPSGADCTNCKNPCK